MEDQERVLEQFKNRFRQSPRLKESEIPKQYKSIYCLKDEQDQVVFRTEVEYTRDTEYIRLMSLGIKTIPVRYRKKI